ncbi:MAG: hypothetical protein HZA28_00075 [Candidatus Omnitrophica bacterium]|nr:hypothetical protein [Candidatus Omnitrophota bacterium]
MASLNWIIFGLVFYLSIRFWSAQSRNAPAVQQVLPHLGMRSLIRASLDWTGQILFHPFSFRKWFLLSFIAFLAGTLFCGGSVLGGKNRDRPAHAAVTEVVGTETAGSAVSPDRQFPLYSDDAMKHKSFQEFQQFSAWAKSSAGIPVLTGIFLAFLIFWLALMWFNARFQFVWYNAVVRNDASVREPLRRFKPQGNALFRLYLVLGLAGLALLLVFVTWLVLPLSGIGVGWQQIAAWPAGIWLNWIAPLFLTGLALFFDLVIAGVFIHDFVVPLMAIEQTTFIPAWRKFLAIYRGHIGDFWKYFSVCLGLWLAALVMAVVVFYVVGLMVVLAGAVAFGLLYFVFAVLLKMTFLFVIIAVILGIPAAAAALAVVLSSGLPFAVFFRSFSLYFFSNLNCGYVFLSLSEISVGENKS